MDRQPVGLGREPSGQCRGDVALLAGLRAVPQRLGRRPHRGPVGQQGLQLAQQRGARRRGDAEEGHRRLHVGRHARSRRRVGQRREARARRLDDHGAVGDAHGCAR